MLSGEGDSKAWHGGLEGDQEGRPHRTPGPRVLHILESDSSSLTSGLAPAPHRSYVLMRGAGIRSWGSLGHVPFLPAPLPACTRSHSAAVSGSRSPTGDICWGHGRERGAELRLSCGQSINGQINQQGSFAWRMPTENPLSREASGGHCSHCSVRRGREGLSEGTPFGSRWE